MNPFKFGAVVQNEFFTNRKKLIQEIINDIHSSQNIVIYGERRIGKTSLIYEVLNKLNNKYPYANMDILGVISINDFCNRYLNSLKNLQQKNIIDSIVKLLSNLRPQVFVDNFGTVNFTLGVENKFTTPSIQDIIALPEKLLKNKKGIVIIDEFQDINNIKDYTNLQAVLRGIIQYHSNITYIFLGSQKHILLNMFTKKNQPFYNSSKIIRVDKIELSEYYDFITNKFKTGKRKISNEIINNIYHLSDGIPNEIQKLCHAIWEITDKNTTITKEIVAHGINKVCSYQRDFFEELIKNLSMYQSRVLLALAKSDEKMIFSKNFISKYDLSTPATVRKAIKVLIDKEIIKKENDHYTFELPFFKNWLLTKYS